ncbi:MAG: DciA family protein [Pseudomonadota bacterium]|nr:DciA family protein [Pseudomonadota bacterium]
MGTDRIDDLLEATQGHHSPLQKLLRNSENQRAWTAELRAVLPDPLCYEVEVTEIRGTTAHLLCGSAATATRLRFMSNELLTRLNDLSSFAQVRELNFRIARGLG